MKNSKTTLLIPLFHLIFSAVFIFIFIGSIREIHSIIESMDHYRNAASEIQPLSQGYLSRLENLARDLRDQGPESAAEFSAEDGFAMIRDLLRTRDITVERFRTTGKGNTAAAEFILNSNGVDFLNFLKGAQEFSIPLSYIGIKPAPNSSTLNVTVRFNHVP
ncbi:hypothetical protein AGMMS49940_07000 [Spirochaetia bacterium]|nr:hypothetical protein AGMMS49940_07000 [Spirochaetia bacterium]